MRPGQSLPLDVVQRWFQAVIINPGGVRGGIEGDAASALIPISTDELESVIGRSSRLDSVGRMKVYADAYYARLIECLHGSFPIVARTLGPDLFADFAMEYLQAHPSNSYTLNRLGDQFEAWLQATRPPREPNQDDSPQWPEFLVDLAGLEWALDGVFDGPGVEQQTVVDAAAVAGLDAARLLDARLETVPCLRLMAFRFPVSEYYDAARQAPDDEELEIPEAKPSWLALTRRDYVVRRLTLSQPQFELLSALHAGNTVAAAIERAAAAVHWDDEQLAASLSNWFHTFTTAPLFQRLITTG
ncbi:MAG: DNA-binding domain-containing protein [Acidobacteriota bacterium]